METAVISSASIAILVLELIKWIVRKYKKDSTFVFPEKFYLIALPVLNILAQPLLAFLAVPGAVMPTDWVSFGRLLVVTALASLASTIGYDYIIGNLKSNVMWAREEKKMRQEDDGVA